MSCGRRTAGFYPAPKADGSFRILLVHKDRGLIGRVGGKHFGKAVSQHRCRRRQRNSRSCSGDARKSKTSCIVRKVFPAEARPCPAEVDVSRASHVLPRGVRFRKPCWMRKGSYTSSIVSLSSQIAAAKVSSPTGPPPNLSIMVSISDGRHDRIPSRLFPEAPGHR